MDKKFTKMYLMNSAVIPQNENGLFQHNTISREMYCKLLKLALAENVEIESYIGYQETASHIREITGYNHVISRDIVLRLKPQTPILVCRLQYRVQNPKDKALHTPSKDDWSYSLMMKIAENSFNFDNFYLSFGGNHE